MLSYREAQDGQILEEGITEAGALSSWIAAATAYSVHGLPMLPFYIYYSMFGFQRVGDLIWAAADQRARGFLLGATAGRTTLGGEGLQHQDGTQPRGRGDGSELPRLRSGLRLRAGGDPRSRHARSAGAAGRRVLLRHGDERELRAALDAARASSDDIIRGMYRLRAQRPAQALPRVRLLGSGAILREVIAAAELLAQDWNIASDVWSVTSFSELAREARGGRALEPPAPAADAAAQPRRAAACRATRR